MIFNKYSMKKKITPQPTDSELEILQLLWQNGESTVRQINELLNKEREVGYTTTLKLMQIMLEKELVIRNANQRTHIYAANVTEGATQKKLLEKFVDATFRGSSLKLVMQTLGSQETTQEELEEIKDLIKQIENKKK